MLNEVPLYGQTTGGRVAADLVTLMRPRLAFLGLVAVAAAYAIAADRVRSGELAALLAFSGLALVGASCLNQALERRTDSLMRRTADRPVAAGRMRPAAAAAVGLVVTVAGLVGLVMWVNGLTAAIAGAGWSIYVLAYTPLKVRSPMATVVGAVPGAVPMLMGWAAARGSIDLHAWALFSILFLWQLPHFLAIAWMYRLDYARAGLRMAPDADADGAASIRQIIAYTLALIPVSLLPSLVGLAGPVYFVGALALGLGYLAFGLGLERRRSGQAARRLLKASVVYLPALLTLLVADASR